MYSRLFVMPDEITPPTPSEIAVCAYLIWEKEGRPAGRVRDHWLQAEAQLRACRAHDESIGDEGNEGNSGQTKTGA